MDLYRTKEVSEILRLGRATVGKLARQGKLPAIKVGQQWRFPATAIDAIKAGKAKPEEMR
jgi:excisionase family DNA binding protein